MVDALFPGDKPVKLEIIILGGTFGDLANAYREQFFKGMYDRLNGFRADNLEQAITANGLAKYRACVVNIETRPDTIDEAECRFLRELGVSKIELGIQSVFDDILEFSGRPYGRDDIVEKLKLIRQEGFKLGLHIMLNLPGSNVKLDRLMLQELRENQDLRPDFLKIYPLTLVREEAHQKQMWDLFHCKRWLPYTREQLLHLLYEFKKEVPEFLRIQRIQRQFDKSDYLYENLKIRNVLTKLLKASNHECLCIRCQELKTFRSGFTVHSDKDYVRSVVKKNNSDHFFSLKSPGVNAYLLAYLRLNTTNRAIVREIKVIGKSSQVGEKGSIQGRGIGGALLSYAELYVRNMGFGSIYVNASPGVRGFFEKRGYELHNHLLRKSLREKAE